MDRSRRRAYVIAFFGWVLAVVLALRVGASDAGSELIIALRLPRAILASAVGMGLAVAGAALQALFANPLCEPYTLGISSGASLGAVVASSFGLGLAFSGLAAPAFFGALVVTGVLYFISLAPGASRLMLLLGGVMLGFLGASLVSLWMALVDPNGLQSALFWLLGDLSRARLSGSVFSLLGVAAISVAIWAHWRDLDALLLGEEAAAASGVDVRSSRRQLVLLTSLLVSLCVASSGMIGFIGLVIPHFARRFAGAPHRRMLPLCALMGAAVLTSADALARALVRPYELPVGVVTALVGAPVFLWVMLRSSFVAGEA